MRIPTEYILALASIGAMSIVAFSVLTTPVPPDSDLLLTPESVIKKTYTPLSEESFSTGTLSELLSFFKWGDDESTEKVEDDVPENIEVDTVVNYSEPEVVKKEIEIIPPIIETVAEPALPSTLQFETFHHYGSSLVEKDPISFATTIKNTDDTFSATSTFIFTFDKFSDGTIDTVLQERTLLPLIPGEAKTESWKNALLPTPGKHTATVCLVSLKEQGFADNCISLEFTVVAQKSDLIVQPLSITPENPIAGGIVSVSSILKNQGKGLADNSITRLRVDAQNNGTWDVILNSPTSALESGGVLPKEWTSAWRSVSGLVKIEVCTDSENVLSESDEQNNCRTDIFTITPGNYIGASSVKFTIEGGLLSPATASVVPGGSVVFTNRDSESYSISGDMGSIFLSPDTEGNMQAPPYEGTYAFFPLYGASFVGTVVVE